MASDAQIATTSSPASFVLMRFVIRKVTGSPVESDNELMAASIGCDYELKMNGK